MFAAELNSVGQMLHCLLRAQSIVYHHRAVAIVVPVWAFMFQAILTNMSWVLQSSILLFKNNWLSQQDRAEQFIFKPFLLGLGQKLSFTKSMWIWPLQHLYVTYCIPTAHVCCCMQCIIIWIMAHTSSPKTSDFPLAFSSTIITNIDLFFLYLLKSLPK